MTNWSFNKTTLSHMLQKSSKRLWRRFVGMAYRTRHIQQTLLFPTVPVHGNGLAEQHSTSYEEAKNWVNWWRKVVANYGQYFELNTLYHFKKMAVKSSQQKVSYSQIRDESGNLIRAGFLLVMILEKIKKNLRIPELANCFQICREGVWAPQRITNAWKISQT